MTATEALALQQSAPISYRTLTLANGTTIQHAVGPISWQDVLHYSRKAESNDTK